MKQASYRIIYFSKADRYVGLAWNYDQAVLIGTKDYESYGDARNELDKLAQSRMVELRWFDGEYVCDGEGDQLTPTNFSR